MTHLYDSDGVIFIPILTLEKEKQNLPNFCLHIFPHNPFDISGHIISKDISKVITALLELWETVQY